MFIVVFFCSCEQEKPKITIFKTNDFVLEDTTILATTFLENNEGSDYPMYYIGPLKNHISIGKRYWRGRTPWNKQHNLICTRYSNKNLSIFVDTTVKTNSPVEYFSEDPQIAKDSTVNYHSFLIIIKNLGDTNIVMGSTFSLYYMHTEVKNKKGDWVKIDKKLSELWICKTGEPFIVLKPKEIILAKVRRYRGSFVTDFRLVFGKGDHIIYSNTFQDSIDEQILLDKKD